MQKMGLPGGWELVIIVLVLVALFGASKLPKMARSLGQSARAFKAEAAAFVKTMRRRNESPPNVLIGRS